MTMCDRLSSSKNPYGSKTVHCEIDPLASYLLAKIHMVAKLRAYIEVPSYGYLLAKIHMVAKQIIVSYPLNYWLSSSKNPYGSKTHFSASSRLSKLSSSKNPYGSKTSTVKANGRERLSSSKNPYGSKTCQS